MIMAVYLILGLIALLVFYFIFLKKHGRLDFWKILSKDPDGAYAYFKKHPQTWLVIDSNSTEFAFKVMQKNPKFKDTWTGPYRLAVPSIGKTIKIYGNVDTYQKEQELVVNNYNRFPKTDSIN